MQIRLNKYLASCGIASRRGAEKLIEEGRVTVDGKIAELTTPVEADESGHALCQVLVDGNPTATQEQQLVLALYKPIGYVCTEAHFSGEKTLQQLIKLPQRVFSIGRLDKDSEGLILMTNDGKLSEEIARSKNHHEKEYEVQINGEVTAEFVEALRGGVDIEIDGRIFTTRPCKVKKTGYDSFNIILTQGFNRQIRRMCLACGARVRSLKRVRVVNINLGDLKPGEYRMLSAEEINNLTTK